MITKLLQSLCSSANIAAAMVIHQPSPMIFDLFDKIVMLSAGRLVFSGPSSSIPGLYTSTFKKPMPGYHDLPHQILKDTEHFTTYLQTQEDSFDKEGLEVTNSTLIPSSTIYNLDIPVVSILWKFYIVFKRNLMNHYITNWTNLLARIVIYTLLALIQGCAFWQVGSQLELSGPDKPLSTDDARSVIGAIYTFTSVMYLLPFSMLSTFSFEKKFFHADSALGLYSPWIYCISQAVLESWVLVIVSILQTAIVFPMIGLWNPLISKWTTLLTALPIMISSNLVGNMIVLMSSICLPSQDLAFLSGAGLVLISLSFSGGVVVFPSMQPFCVWMKWLSPVKYSVQAFLTLTFWGTKNYEVYVQMVDLDDPDMIIANVCILFLIFAIMSAVTIVALARQREVR
jgi:hypothetical protein